MFIYLYVIKKTRVLIDTPILILISIYFVSNSLSIINSINVVEYLRVYKNILISIIFFFITAYFFSQENKSKIILTVFILTVVFNVFIQLSQYFILKYESMSLLTLFHSTYVDFIRTQANRERYFIEFYDYALIPLLIYFAFKIRIKIFSFMLLTSVLILFFLSIVSGYRIIFIATMISIISTAIILSGINLKKLFLILIIILSIFIVGKQVGLYVSEHNSIARLSTLNEESLESISGRFYLWRNAIEMGQSYKYFGIGLGNFFDHLSNKNMVINSYFDPKNQLMRYTYIHPHNIFFAAYAEIGFVGLISIVSLIGYFFYMDVKKFFKKNTIMKVFIASFWILFLYSLTGPRQVIQYLIVFWFLRFAITTKKEKRGKYSKKLFIKK